MADVKLADLLALYQTPAKTENPSVNLTALRRIVSDAGTKFPFVRTSGYLTDIALPEADGDLHFFIETKKSSEMTDIPMMTCEIQGLFKVGKKKGSDTRIPSFKQLFAEHVEVTALFRMWPEHLRDSRQPHLFELHPLLTIGKVGAKPLDFSDRIVWPTGEDPDEMARELASIIASPKGLKLSKKGSTLELATPTHSMKRENYVHVDGYFRGGVRKQGPFLQFALYDGPQSQRSISCLAFEGSASHTQLSSLKQGHYEVGGLCGLDIRKLIAATPTWAPQMCPVLSLRSL